MWVGAADDRKKERAKAIDFLNAFSNHDFQETRPFWVCVLMDQKVDHSIFSEGPAKFSQRIKAKFVSQPMRSLDLADHLLNECVPKIEHGRRALDQFLQRSGGGVALVKYQQSLPKLQSGLKEYADNLKQQETEKGIGQLIHDMVGTWREHPPRQANAATFDAFLDCAIPNLDDADDMLAFLNKVCLKDNPTVFMDRVRTQCEPLLANLDGGKKTRSKSIESCMRACRSFLDDQDRQVQAWERCETESRKREHLDNFLGASADYVSSWPHR